MFASFPQHLIMSCGQTKCVLNLSIIESRAAYWKSWMLGGRARMETSSPHNHLQYKMDISLSACKQHSNFTWETPKLGHREFTCDAEWSGTGVNDPTGSTQLRGNWRVSTVGRWGNCQIDGRGLCFGPRKQLKTLAQHLLSRCPGVHRTIHTF